MTGEERRKNKRICGTIDAQFLLLNRINPGKVDPHELMLMREATLVDISSTGASLDTAALQNRWDLFLKRGDAFLVLKFVCPLESRPVCAMGQVRWLRSREGVAPRTISCGVHFVDITATDRLILRNFIIRQK